MRRIFLVFVAVMVMLAAVTTEADETPSKFSGSILVQYLSGEDGGAINQLGLFGSYRVIDWLSIDPWMFFGASQGEIDAAVSFYVGKTGLFFTPAIGGSFSATDGHADQINDDLIIGYDHPWVEVRFQSFYSDSIKANVTSNLFERAWLQVGKADLMYSKFGVQMESTNNVKNADWERAMTYIGPRASFMKSFKDGFGFRFDIFYGLVAADATPDVKGDAPRCVSTNNILR